MLAALAIPTVILTAWMIVKKYQTHTTLILSGMFMLTLGIVFTQTGVADVISAKYGFKDTGAAFFDIFKAFDVIMSQRTATIGMVAMTAAGFSTYMTRIGAADSLVKACSKPLEALNKPYLVLAVAYLIGQALNIVISSPAGLAMLLLVSVYPILVRAGVSPLSAAAAIGTTGALDLGPGSGNANVAAETLGLPIAEYFATKQLLVAIPVAIIVAATHYFVQQWFDKREGEELGEYLEGEKREFKSAPAFYAFLPFAPIALLLMFSSIGVPSIKMNAPTAMYVALIATIFIDAVRNKSIQTALDNGMSFFKGMANAFSSIVVLIVAATMFTLGLNAIGAIDALKEMVLGGDVHYILITIFAMLIIGLTSILTGSGNAAFFSFANLGPELAAAAGVKTILMLLPMQFMAGFCRSLSPVSAVIIAVSAASNVSPFGVLKRTAIPMAVGIVSTLIITQFVF
ncbi:C4-dicarboxylate transporter DcuC [Vibrio mediterranei]|uniref:C4-dicarboxylate transporter DcuC n=1 Tax=Vibrio mediterranei TaxID=689 RepID=UPI001EFE3223|nr:C4-dicarboxylate transporter DcuC [Vibrio mediterranei]MCG9628411.1 C4-dicarboxylate transporter DcuC [Vibrio mediterranei]